MDTPTHVTRPLLRYHGGKWRLAPWIIEHFPPHRVYVEPFGGGGSVLLRKPRTYAEVYNDLYGELVNLFRVVRDRGYELLAKLELTPFSRNEFLDSYQPSECPVEQARRTLVRSFMGFGSNALSSPTGFRSNSNRSGTTPARDWKNYPDSFTAVIERLRGVVIENRDAIKVMDAHDSPQTLHYVDPPYMPQTRSGCVGYTHELSEEEHEHLLTHLRELMGMVVISGYQCELYEDILSDWSMVKKHTHADGGRARIECLWLSPAATQKQHELTLFTSRKGSAR